MVNIATGYLQIETYIAEQMLPLANVMVRIFKDQQGELIYEDYFMTNHLGKTIMIPLYTPKDAASNHRKENYHIEVRCTGYEVQEIINIPIYASEISYLPIWMIPCISKHDKEDRNIDYIKQSSIMDSLRPPIHNKLTMERMPSDILIENDTKQSFTLPFSYYLKNCASSILDPRWPREAIKIFIMMLTNKIFAKVEHDAPTKTYRIDVHENSFVWHRNIFNRISEITDDILGMYISSEDSFCLYENASSIIQYASQGYSTNTILSNICDHQVHIQRLENEHSLCSPFATIGVDSKVDVIKQLQEQLSAISQVYPVITNVKVNGKYDALTQSAIRVFQNLFHLKADGIVGKRTFYKISYIYHKILSNPQVNNQNGAALPKDIKDVQKKLQHISLHYKAIPSMNITGELDNHTIQAITVFQRMLGITADGILNQQTWKLIKQMDKELTK